jgi:[ribosomal protein S18]-alanine N-acetyltransferase
MNAKQLRGDRLAEVTVTPFQRRYREDVRDLLFRTYRMHSHLDWYDTDQWLETDDVPMRLAWAGGRLAGFMAASQPLNNTSWIRLAAVADDIQPQPVMTHLWDALVDDLRARAVRTVALLVLRDWVVHYLSPHGFHYVEDIVTLRRAMQSLPDAPRPPLNIRVSTPDDINIIAAIDQAAFAPPWQLSLPELRQAQRVSAICTVAERDGEIIGYQLSTLYFDGGHLARLAVQPFAQGNGIGAALLHDLIQRFMRRGVGSITVNTQASNTRSQRLYQRFGFERNGYDLPVWMAEI